jgi:hypothetical protein
VRSYMDRPPSFLRARQGRGLKLDTIIAEELVSGWLARVYPGSGYVLIEAKAAVTGAQDPT